MEGDRFLHSSASAIWEAMGSKEAQFHLYLKAREARGGGAGLGSQGSGCP